ncbi:hypothetical protein KSP35_12930 [Aquihabitans sp. G128]|uniref:hypothetical protein n=1 Tax=Aquihabitans sp. G128 TaxID=2849779 RepID=UPI001C2427EB|nr:hypothetical protein [Aquihabitans sp. G128]QXC59308.1 hypothetical protein KSP35_12930 [Aquihabitans sp. G128]
MLAIALVAVLGALAVGAAPASAHRSGFERPAQYRPGPLPTTTTAVAVAPAAQGRGVDAPSGGALATTGADSRTWAGRGLALLLAGIGVVLMTRRSTRRTIPTHR